MALLLEQKNCLFAPTMSLKLAKLPNY